MRHVDDRQASMIAAAMREQRLAIVSALARLAAQLRFDEHAAAHGGETSTWPDVLRMRRASGRAYLFVGHARGFGEPARDATHSVALARWMRRFARLVDKHRGKGAPHIDGGYVIVGTQDAQAADAWAAQLTALAHTYRIQRDGGPARFVVRPLGEFWMAC